MLYYPGPLPTKTIVTKYLVIAAILSAIDLVTTWIAGISYEGNPIVRWIWAYIGFWFLIPTKMLLLLMMASIWHWIGTTPLSPRFHKIFRAILVAEIVVPLGATCLWNIYWLLN